MIWRMGKKQTISSGYTLIEILIGLTIVGLIFSYGFVNFREFSRRQALAGAARKLRGELRFAQELALSGKKPDDSGCNNPNALIGYNFKVSSSTYAIEAVCSGGVVGVKSIDLSTGISASAPSTNPILFKVLGQGTNLSSDATITLTQNSTESTQDVFVSVQGEIK